MDVNAKAGWLPAVMALAQLIEECNKEMEAQSTSQLKEVISLEKRIAKLESDSS